MPPGLHCEQNRRCGQTAQPSPFGGSISLKNPVSGDNIAPRPEAMLRSKARLRNQDLDNPIFHEIHSKAFKPTIRILEILVTIR
jgi:hypothetical protein